MSEKKARPKKQNPATPQTDEQQALTESEINAVKKQARPSIGKMVGISLLAGWSGLGLSGRLI